MKKNKDKRNIKNKEKKVVFICPYCGKGGDYCYKCEPYWGDYDYWK